mgnify:CR=1 FL=1
MLLEIANLPYYVLAIRTTIIENETRRVSTFAPWYNAIREKSNDKNAMRNFLSGMLKHFEYDYNDEQDVRTFYLLNDFCFGLTSLYSYA